MHDLSRASRRRRADRIRVDASVELQAATAAFATGQGGASPGEGDACQRGGMFTAGKWRRPGRSRGFAPFG
jgi:hypothetical protein